MSRAFVKEGSGELDPLPDLPIPSHPNYVTARGLRELREKLVLAQAELTRLRARPERLDKLPEAAAERDIRYLEARLKSAMVVDVAAQGTEVVGFGHLVTGGVGTRFNLMGPVQANAVFRIAPTDVFDALRKQTKTRGLLDIPEFRKLPKAQPVELYNYTNFYSLRDLVFWHILFGAGSYPSTLVHMARNFPLGKIVQNSMYMPAKPSRDARKPAIMTFDRLRVSFPTQQIEWMEQPLYGGLVKETMQAENLLTTKESKVSHPYLQPVKEGKVRWQGRSWYYRYFLGTTPKDGLTGPGMGPETRKRTAK